MPGTTPIYGLPYPESTDLVANYPALGQDLAEDLDSILNGKAATSLVKVIQVVSATYSTETSTTSTSFVTTNLSASITPSSITNKVLILVTNTGNVGATTTAYYTIYRGTTSGTNLGSTSGFAGFTGSTGDRVPIACAALDSPSTTSATTYTFAMKSDVGSTVRAQALGATATMILMEVAA